MKTKLFGLFLFTLTAAAVAWYPGTRTGQGGRITDAPKGPPVVDVVFVLDTTGSMGGLIQTAKEKIWSIASTMAAAQPTPEIRIGLVGYRDRDDAYVTRVVDLSDDLDSVHAALMQFTANGGGDTPEDVNQALYDAVNRMSWSQRDQAYQVIFLVGDAPPHMDYDQPQFPAIVAAAAERGIVVNTIQCGNLPTTFEPWTAIARLGQGEFFQVEQSGGAVAFTSPFDVEIAQLSANLDDTRLYYGSVEQRSRMEKKVVAARQLNQTAPVSSLARRGTFNAAEGGRSNLLGENELVDAVTSGEISLDEIEPEALPEPLKAMAPAAQAEFVAGLAEKRHELQRQILDLGKRRDEYIRQQVEEAGGLEDSLDSQLFEVVRDQAFEAGFEYDADAPAY